MPSPASRRCASVLSRLQGMTTRRCSEIPQLWRRARSWRRMKRTRHRRGGTCATSRRCRRSTMRLEKSRTAMRCVLLDESKPIRLSELPDELPDYALQLRHRAVRVLLADAVAAMLSSGGTADDVKFSRPDAARFAHLRPPTSPSRPPRRDRTPRSHAQRRRPAERLDDSQRAARRRPEMAYRWARQKVVRARLCSTHRGQGWICAAEMMFANLHEADCRAAELRRAVGGGRGSGQREAPCGETAAGCTRKADFTGADLTRVIAHGAQLRRRRHARCRFHRRRLHPRRVPARQSPRRAPRQGGNCARRLTDPRPSTEKPTSSAASFPMQKLVGVQLSPPCQHQRRLSIRRRCTAAISKACGFATLRLSSAI